MKKHLCILICYQNYEHIMATYNSLKSENIDFIIIENKSQNTELIKEFFLKQPIKKYVLFKNNIVNNAMNIFLKDFFDLLGEYEYITISDCDLLIEDSDETFREIFAILEDRNVGVCCIDLDMKNLPDVTGAKNWVPPIKMETETYLEGDSGIHLMTIRNENIDILKNVHFLDSNLIRKCNKNNKKWVKTKKNRAIHLTWDLYKPGNPYYEFKKKNKNMWHERKESEYDILK